MLAENFGVDWIRVNLPFPCEIHWCRPIHLEQNDNYKVLMLNSEPSEFLISVEDLAHTHQFFDLIIAYDPRYGIYPNCVIHPFGSLYATKLPSAKEFSVSYLFSIGSSRPKRIGYAERLRFMHEQQLGSAVPLRIFKGRQFADVDHVPYPLLPNDSKDTLFDSMFHVAIENAFDPHYFSEKLMDCLATYTVPIYMGCPNIGDYFDTDGMIIVPPDASIMDAINRLTIADYWKRMKSIQENRRLSIKHLDYLQAFRSLILKAACRGGTRSAGAHHA